jgi:translation initiation factor 1A
MGKPEICPFREDGQTYAKVTAMLGNNRCSTRDADGVERLGIIRGNMRRRQWISVKDVVLLALRDFQDAKADIVHRYPDDEVRRLVRYGEISKEFANDLEKEAADDTIADVIFEDDDDIDDI